MRSYLTICLIFVSVIITACMPVIVPSPSPKESITAILPEHYKKTNSMYLILPVWDKYPSYYDETSWKKDHKNIAGKPFYISGAEIDIVHEKIPRKMNVGMACLAANTGREIVPKGIIIFSEDGQSTFVKLCKTTKIFDLKWCGVYEFQIEDSDRKDFIEMLKAGKKNKVIIKRVFDSAISRYDYIRSGTPYIYQ